MGQLEAKIYSWTDTFSNPRLQRSKHSNNSDKSSEQKDMHAGAGIFFDTREYCSAVGTVVAVAALGATLFRPYTSVDARHLGASLSEQ